MASVKTTQAAASVMAFIIPSVLTCQRNMNYGQTEPTANVRFWRKADIRALRYRNCFRKPLTTRIARIVASRKIGVKVDLISAANELGRASPLRGSARARFCKLAPILFFAVAQNFGRLPTK